MSEQDEARERSLELIRAAHAFPGPFQVRVVHHPGVEDAVLDALREACQLDDAIAEMSARASRNGRFRSMAVTLNLVAAEEVLVAYAALKQVEGVITVL